MSSISASQGTVLVRVSPILTSLALLSIMGLCAWWAGYMIAHENDSGYFMTRTAEGRWTMAALGLAAFVVVTFSLITQILSGFVWAVGTKDGIHAAMTPRRGIPPVRVPGPPSEISLTSTRLRWGQQHLVFENGDRRFDLVVLRSNAERAQQAFDNWSGIPGTDASP